MNPNEFIDAVENKYPKNSYDLILKKTLSKITDYFGPILRELVKRAPKTSYILQNDKMFVQFRIDLNLLRFKIEDNRIQIIFMSEKENPYSEIGQDLLLDEIVVENEIPVLKSKNTPFEASQIDSFLKYLLV